MRFPPLLFAVLLLLAPAAFAQSPREQLNQLATQLRASPGDAALRERVIKLGQEIRPAPAVPEEARRPFVQGNSAFQDAKTPADFDRAIALYRSASDVAPWWGDPYFNLAKALEQNQRFADAIAALKLYLLASPDAADARQAQDRIYALEERVDRVAKATAAQAEAAQNAAAMAALGRQWAQSLVQQLNGMFAGKLVRDTLECSLDPNRFTGCTLQEKSGNNWYTFHPVYPAPIRFALSPDGGKIQLFETLDNGPRFGKTEVHRGVGTPGGVAIGLITWLTEEGKPAQMRFFVNSKGDSVFEHSDAPVPIHSSSFLPSVRYRYSQRVAR